MDASDQLNRAVEKTSPDLTRVTEEQSKVIETNRYTEDTMSCNDISTSIMDSCFEANTGSKVMNENSHESTQQELDDMQEVLGAEDKVLTVHCHHSEEVEEISPDLTRVTEEQNKVIETKKNTEDTTSCNDISTSSMGSCFEANTGSKVMNESSHESTQQLPTQELDDMQEVLGAEDKVLMVHCHHSEEVEETSPDLAGATEEKNKVIETNEDTEDATDCNDIITSSTENCSEVNTGSGVMNKNFQERPTTLELDDVQRIQRNEDKVLHQQKTNNQANTNQSSLGNTTELDQSKNNDEKQTLEAELQKCIEDLKKLKIPSTFLKKQRHWQNELLKKYDV
ncbi:enolase-phosphatase E1-like [Heptranchias perlo]|uniref:enolase-phosphatase E1-like n=1 Tax=Heptranchias perlo TaxID=212740 RepID=UPI0035594520